LSTKRKIVFPAHFGKSRKEEKVVPLNLNVWCKRGKATGNESERRGNTREKSGEGWWSEVKKSDLKRKKRADVVSQDQSQKGKLSHLTRKGDL